MAAALDCDAGVHSEGHCAGDGDRSAQTAVLCGEYVGKAAGVRVAVLLTSRRWLDCKSVGLAFEGSNPSPATGFKQPLTLAYASIDVRHPVRAQGRMMCLVPSAAWARCASCQARGGSGNEDSLSRCLRRGQAVGLLRLPPVPRISEECVDIDAAIDDEPSALVHRVARRR